MKQDLMMFLSAMAVAMVTVVMAQDCETQPPAAMCRALLPAWFYNTETGRCERRECHQGRDNRYRTQEECEQQCGAAPSIEHESEEGEESHEEGDDNICQLPAVIGPCRARHRRFFFDTASGRCKKFFFGGCRGNGNNFAKKSDCQVQCEGRSDERSQEISPN